LLKSGLIEIVEDNINGRWYPLVYITGKGRETLKEKESEFSPNLEKVLEANRTLIEFQKEISIQKCSPRLQSGVSGANGNGGEKNA